MSSLKDLAQECGVSVATVSKALNGQPDISEATRARVREAARRMGYVPNMAARSMKTNRTYNIGVLFVDEQQSGLAHEFSPLCWTASKSGSNNWATILLLSTATSAAGR